VFLAKYFPVDCQGLLKVQSGACIVTCGLQQGAQVVEAVGGLGMFLAQHSPVDGQGLLVVWPGACIVA
jgi:hypothetical protein